MNFIVLNETPLQVVELTDAKRQLHRFDSEDDQHINMVILAASEMVEQYTDRFYRRNELQVLLPSEGTYCLPKSDNVNILTCKDENDVAVTYSVDPYTNEITVDSACTVTYKTGIENAPAMVKMACLRIISDLYQHREDDVFTTQKQRVSVTSWDALDKFKRVAL